VGCAGNLGSASSRSSRISPVFRHQASVVVDHGRGVVAAWHTDHAQCCSSLLMFGRRWARKVEAERGHVHTLGLESWVGEGIPRYRSGHISTAERTVVSDLSRIVRGERGRLGCPIFEWAFKIE
jgi:hypothetical protein